MGDPRDGFTCNDDGTRRDSPNRVQVESTGSVTKEMREGHFNATGQYAADQEIYAWFVNLVLQAAQAKSNLKEYMIENTHTS